MALKLRTFAKNCILITAWMLACLAADDIPLRINTHAAFSSALPKELLKDADRHNIGLIESGYAGVYVTDHVYTATIDLNFETWMTDKVKSKFSNETDWNASMLHGEIEKNNDIIRQQAEKMCSTYNIPCLSGVDASANTKVAERRRVKRGPAIIVAGLVVSAVAVTALGVTGAAYHKADLALKRTSTILANQKLILNATTLLTETMQAQSERLDLLKAQVDYVNDLSLQNFMRTEFQPLFSHQQQLIQRGLEYAILHNSILPGFVSHKGLADVVNAAFSAEQLIYDEHPHLVSSTTKVILRSIDIDSLRALFVLATPIIRESDLYVLIDVTPFGAFGSGNSEFTVPMLPFEAAIPPMSTTLQSAKYPSASCRKRGIMKLCSPFEMKDVPDGQLCPLGVRAGTVCKFRHAKLRPNKVFVKVQHFGDAYVIATTCKKYRKFMLDNLGRPVHPLGEHPVPAPIAVYKIPYNIAVDFCPSVAVDSGTKTVKGFGSNNFVVDGIDPVDINTNVLKSHFWNQTNVQMKTIKARVVQKTNTAFELLSQVKDEFPEMNSGGKQWPVYIAVAVLALMLLLLVLYICLKRNGGEQQSQTTTNTNIMITGATGGSGNGLPTFAKPTEPTVPAISECAAASEDPPPYHYPTLR